MPSHIKIEPTGAVSAFTANNRLVMNGDHPTVSTFLRVKEMHDWVTTLEEVMVQPNMAHHRYHLEAMYFAFKGAIRRHQEEHAEVVSEAPTAEDLLEYLVSYSRAIAGDD